jgi:hypothetical protein
VSAPRNFIVTAHAQKRAAERNITKTEFIETVSRPNGKRRQRRGDHGGIVYLFTRKFGTRELHISAELFKTDCFFITGYWT